MPQFLTHLPSDGHPILAEVIDLLDAGLVVLDSGLRLVLVNRRFVELVGEPSGPTPTLRGTLDRLLVEFRAPWPQDMQEAACDRLEAALCAGGIEGASIVLRNGVTLSLGAVRREDRGWVLTLAELTQADDAERLAAELRYNNETLEGQAAHLAALAEAADASARAAEEARCRLEREVAERRKLEVRLRHMATTDALTGMLNRAQFLTLAQREVGQARPVGLHLAVVMLDVDHFKAINDQYGHAAGDKALQHLAALLRSGTRRADLLGRMGGEEFAVVLPAVSEQIAMDVAERLRALVADTPFTFDGRQIAMSASLGVALLAAGEMTIEPALARADAALYTAKRGGRNRAVRAAAVECAA